MSLNGRLIGVTSHFTPLPMGEGPGEGPLGVECGAARSGGEAGSFFSLPSLAF